MEGKNSWRFALVLIVLLMIIDTIYYYPRMVDPMATHFDGSGAANGWSSKNSFLGLYAVMMVVILLSFWGSVALMRVIPARFINLPHRDYWLAPERKEETLAVFSKYLYWFGAATMALLAGILHECFLANLQTPPRLERPWLYLGFYLGFTAVWLIVFYRRFRKPDSMP